MLTALLLAAAMAAPVAMAQDTNFKVFGAAAYVAPLSDTSISGVGDAIEASSELGWSAGFEWRINELFGLQLDATWADHDVEASTGTLGSVTLQPLAATVNFHLINTKVVDFYVGGGFAYVNFGDLETASGDLNTDAESTWQIQAGLDIGLSEWFFITAGLRYYDLSVQVDGVPDEVAIDPLVTTVGVGFRW
jgi:outer membrane protein W